MSSELPSYEATVSIPPPPQQVNYRLYVQYDTKHKQGLIDPIQLRTSGFVAFNTGVPALKTFILPSAEPVDQILEKAKFRNPLTIVFEGKTESELLQISQMFTSLKYWNSFSYAESLVFNQQYSVKVIKQVTKSVDRCLRSLIVNFSSFEVIHTRTHRFTGPPKGGTKYTLHVTFQKTWVQFKGQQGEFEKFITQSKPTSCAILEQQEILEFHQNSHYTGPTTEFLIKGDNFVDFQKARNAFMNLKLPNPRASACSHVINIHSECLEVLQKTPESDKFLIKLGNWEADLNAYFLYG